MQNLTWILCWSCWPYLSKVDFIYWKLDEVPFKLVSCALCQEDVKLLFVQIHASRWNFNLCFTEEETGFFEFESKQWKGTWTQFQLVGGCLTPTRNSQTPAGYPRSQPNSSGTIYSDIKSDSTGKGFSAHKTALNQAPITSPGCCLCWGLTGYTLEVPSTPFNSGCQLQVQALTCTSDWPAINQRFPWPSPCVWLICYNGLQDSFESLDYWFITKHIKGYESTATWRDT